jgi:hypothetical protein
MSAKKKAVREAFRTMVFERDKHCCVMCGKHKSKLKPGQFLDSHHINDRHSFPDGGYTLDNGVTLCAGEDKTDCHWKAEQYHATGKAYPGYSPEEIKAKINESQS